MIYDKVFITNLPSFYKINLYNEISRREKIYVIFTGDDSKSRNADFFKGNIEFPYFYYKNKNILYRVIFSVYLLCVLSYDELVISGWDSLPLWIFACFSQKNKNSVVIESSYIESTTVGIRGYLKKIFISRIHNKVYVSGRAQEKLAKLLGCNATIIKTHGVGLFNIIEQPKYVPREVVKNFIFVGRLVEVKNLDFLIKVFNKLPNYNLIIVGFGDQEQYLKSISNKNIIFKGVVENKKLPRLYQNNDVFILPSKSEVWGLVVEEALNNGLPIIVSNRVGCAEEIVSNDVGLVFDYNSEDDLIKKIKIISNVEFYNKLRKNISKIDFTSIRNAQINSYLC